MEASQSLGPVGPFGPAGDVEGISVSSAAARMKWEVWIKWGACRVTWDLVGPLFTVPFSYPAMCGHPVFTSAHISIEEARDCMTFSYL